MTLSSSCRNAGSVQYLATGRCDVHFEMNVRAKGDKKPMKASWARLNRLVRYMGRTPSARVVIMKPGADYDPHVACLRVWSESDKAGNAKDGKN